MPCIHVLLNKEHVDPRRLPGKVVIVLDVVFATTSIITALEHGASEVIPTMGSVEAIAAAARRSAGSYVLAGELNTETIPGFVDPWPIALLAQQLRGKALIYSTTNGTVALNQSAGASHVYAGALVNGEALMRHVAARHLDETVLLVCSGSGANFNMEDFYGAGYLASLLLGTGSRYQPTDAALAAMLFHEDRDALECIRRSRVGRILGPRGLHDDLAFAARKSVFQAIPEFSAGRLNLVSAEPERVP